MRAAFYESDITPPLGCYQTGYGIERYAEDVYNKLYSKALVVEDGGNYAVIISIDICEYPSDLHDKVTKRIEEYTGISSDCVCVHSTHAHWGAPVTDNPQINCFGDEAYKKVFYRLVADSAILAYKRLDECKALYGSVDVPGIANNRCSVLKDGTLRTFVGDPDIIERPFSEPDHELPVLFVEKDGKKIGALYSFGCHQDTVNTNGAWGYSGDYSSVVSDYLKKEYGSDFVSIYIAAPSGDINHINPFAKTEAERSKPWTEIGRLLYDGIRKASENLSDIGTGVCVVKELMNIPKRKYDNDEFTKLAKAYLEQDKGCGGRITNLVYYQRADKTEFAKLYVQIIKIGELAIFVYPGEMFSEYSHRTKESSPFKYTMVVENSNAYGGYIAPPEAYEENSFLYEIAPAHDSFVAKDGGEMLYNKMIELSDSIK